jgi:hypothetical protein
LPVAAVIITTIAALVVWRVSRERRPRARGGPR